MVCETDREPLAFYASSKSFMSRYNALKTLNDELDEISVNEDNANTAWEMLKEKVNELPTAATFKNSEILDVIDEGYYYEFRSMSLNVRRQLEEMHDLLYGFDTSEY